MLSNRSSLLVLAIAGLASSELWVGTPASYGGTITFVNLSGNKVFVAKQVYDGGGSGYSLDAAGSNDSGLSYFVEPHFKHMGWTVIEPGRSFEDTSAAFYYVETNGGELKWKDRGVSLGVVKAAQFSNVELRKGAGVPQSLLNQGYRKVSARNNQPCAA